MSVHPINPDTPDPNHSDEGDVPYQAPRRKGKPDTTLSGGAVTGLNLGDLGTAEVLVIESISVDADYQRDLRHDLVNKIGLAYDIVKAGPILVSERSDGSLWCVDGQHRMVGAQQAGETEIFAHVVHGLTRAQEAELRLARNDRKTDTQQEKFRTRLVMGDPIAHQLVEIVGQHGSEINLIPTGHRGINAIATLELLYNIDHKGVWLGRVLRMLNEIFRHETQDVGESALNPVTCSTSMLKATCWMIGQHIDAKEVGWTEFVERLSSVGIDDLRRKTVNHKAVNGGALWLNTYRAMVEIYNFRRSDARKLKWRTTGSLNMLGADGVKPAGWTADKREKLADQK